MIQDCACLKKNRFQMSITSNVKQSELLVYFIGALIILKAIESGSVTSSKIGLPSISAITGEPVSVTLSTALFW